MPDYEETERMLFENPDDTVVTVYRPDGVWLPAGVSTIPFNDGVLFNITVAALKAAWAAHEGD